MWNASRLGPSLRTDRADVCINEAFLEHYRVPEEFAYFQLTGELSRDCGYFRFGEEAICYGRTSASSRPDFSGGWLPDSFDKAQVEDGCVWLPFDPTEVIGNLRLERYAEHANLKNSAGGPSSIARNAYYLVRPLLPGSARGILQRIHLRNWDKIAFPQWPVDRSVDSLFEDLLLLALEANGRESIPFIWFWPEGASGCCIMTHDVETTAGRDFCGALMDMDDTYGIKSSFQVVPEQRYDVSEEFLESIRERGFELNVHDLNHDGKLFEDPDEFQRRARSINRHMGRFGAQGFRSGAMYHNVDWYGALKISYDMSVPNVAHLEPQRGGCCTVMPYFIGDVLELPLTATQDYSIFSIMRRYSIDLWQRQIDLILEKNGLISFIVHPDYVIESRAQAVYEDLLQYVSDVCDQRNVWRALPSDVNTWWRQREQMTLVRDDGSWRIEGEGSERALVAYAEIVNGRLAYSFEPVPAPLHVAYSSSRA